MNNSPCTPISQPRSHCLLARAIRVRLRSNTHGARSFAWTSYLGNAGRRLLEADGAIRFVAYTADNTLLIAQSTRSGGEFAATGD
jgi:hypothetical protein